jgi:hypothetical protein
MSSQENPVQDTEKEQEITRLKEEIAARDAKLANAGSELSTMRQSKAEIEGERDALKVKLQSLEQPTPATDAAEVVKQALEARDREDAQRSKASAETAFKNSHKEFHPDNDPGGLKFEAYKAYLKKFSDSGLKSEKDFSTLYEDAYVLMNKGQSPKDERITPSPHVPLNPSNPPREISSDKLTYEEKRVVERLGWTEDKFLKMKETRPDYIKSLFKNL